VIGHYDKSISTDFQKEMQQRNGIIKGEEPKTALSARVCLRCGEKNSFDLQHCGKCGLRLDITREELMQNTTNLEKDMKDLKQELAEIKSFARWLERNPQIKKSIEEITNHR